MPVAALEIRPLSPTTLPDFLAFCEGDGFADHPKWASCYCQFLYVDHNQVDWKQRSAADNRAACCARVEGDRMQGYLAYREGRVVGWCNAAPRNLLDGLADEPDPDSDRIGAITCFVVALPQRRTGVATALLDAACAGLKAQGLEIAEALPLTDVSTDAQNHYGPLSMYLAAGFTVHRTDGNRAFVRKPLA